MGINCFNANFLHPLEDFRVARKTELNAPFPTLQCTLNSLLTVGIDVIRFVQLSFAETACLTVKLIYIYFNMNNIKIFTFRPTLIYSLNIFDQIEAIYHKYKYKYLESS